MHDLPGAAEVRAVQGWGPGQGCMLLPPLPDLDDPSAQQEAQQAGAVAEGAS